MTEIFNLLLSSNAGILLIFFFSLAFGLLMLKVRDFLFDVEIGHVSAKIDFQKKVMEEQESNLKKLQKKEDWYQI